MLFWQCYLSSGCKGHTPQRVALSPPRGAPSFTNPKSSQTMSFEPSVKPYHGDSQPRAEPYHEDSRHVDTAPATTSTYDNQVQELAHKSFYM